MRRSHGWLMVMGVMALSVASQGVWVAAQQSPQAEKADPSAVKDPSASPPPSVIRVRDEKEPPAPAEDFPVYRPPIRCAPAGRLAAGTRGPGEAVPAVAVLAPEHVGLTLHEQPSLYWFLSRESRFPVELTLIATEAVQPLAEVRLAPPVQAGIHAFRLSEHGVRLKAGTSYRFFVAVMLDPDRRSRDVLAEGAVALAECPQDAQVRLKEVARARKPFAYAEEGLWYDALQSLSELIEAAPRDTLLRRGRAALLQQVGLHEAAVYEQGQVQTGERP